jgi:hypothetical protein
MAAVARAVRRVMRRAPGGGEACFVGAGQKSGNRGMCKINARGKSATRPVRSNASIKDRRRPRARRTGRAPASFDEPPRATTMLATAAARRLGAAGCCGTAHLQRRRLPRRRPAPAPAGGRRQRARQRQPLLLPGLQRARAQAARPGPDGGARPLLQPAGPPPAGGPAGDLRRAHRRAQGAAAALDGLLAARLAGAGGRASTARPRCAWVP